MKLNSNIRVRVTEDEYERIVAFAKKDRRNVSQFARNAMLEKCDRMEAALALTSAGPLFDLMSKVHEEMQEEKEGT